MDSVLSRVAVSATLIAVGSLARNAGYVSRADGQALLRLIFSVTLPAVLLSIFATASLSAAPAVVLISLVHAVLLGFLALSWSPAQTGRSEAAVLVAASFGVNLGLFAVRWSPFMFLLALTLPQYPFVASLFGAAGLATVVVFDLGNQVVLLVAQPLLMLQRLQRLTLANALPAISKRLLNPCMLALYCALLLKAFSLGLPAPVAALTGPLSAANAPLALLALGILLDVKVSAQHAAAVAAVLGAKYAISLSLAAAVVLFAPLSQSTVPVIIAALTAPVPMLAIAYSVEMGLDAALPTAIVNVSLLCSFALLVGVAQIAETAPQALAPASALLATVALVISLLAQRTRRQLHSAPAAVSACLRPLRVEAIATSRCLALRQAPMRLVLQPRSLLQQPGCAQAAPRKFRPAPPRAAVRCSFALAGQRVGVLVC